MKNFELSKNFWNYHRMKSARNFQNMKIIAAVSDIHFRDNEFSEWNEWISVEKKKKKQNHQKNREKYKLAWLMPLISSQSPAFVSIKQLITRGEKCIIISSYRPNDRLNQKLQIWRIGRVVIRELFIYKGLGAGIYTLHIYSTCTYIHQGVTALYRAHRREAWRSFNYVGALDTNIYRPRRRQWHSFTSQPQAHLADSHI